MKWCLPRSVSKGLVLDLVLSLGLFALALATRLPYFSTIPMINDERHEVMLALNISQGVQFPLANVATYIGPLFLYLLAGVFRIFGASPEMPRLFVLVLGALAVVATYWLGKVWANRLAGFIGAGLLVTAGTHIFVNSHIANSAATTPLFTTLSILAFNYAKKNGSVWAWIVGGGLFGCALQTHPTAIFLAPPLLLWFLLDGKSREQLRTRGPVFAALAVVVAYLPLLVHNALSWGTARGSLTHLEQASYTFTPPSNIGDYIERVFLQAHEVLRMFAAAFTVPERWSEYLWSVLGIYLVLLIVSLVFLVRRGNPLPALAFLFAPPLLAIIHGRSHFPNDSRYYAYLLPLGLLSIGIFGDALLRAIWNLAPNRVWWSRSLSHGRYLSHVSIGAIVRVVVCAFILVNLVRLAIYPLYVLVGVNHFFLINNFTGSEMLDMTRRVKASSPTRVWMDQDLYGSTYWMCDGATAGNVLAYFLTLSSVPTITAPAHDMAPSAGEWLAVTPEHASALDKKFNAKEIAATQAGTVHCAPPSIVLYQVQ